MTTFNTPNSTQTYTVPSGVTRLVVIVNGAGGGDGGNAGNDSGGSGGSGGYVYGILSVSSGDGFTIELADGGETGATDISGGAGSAGGLSPFFSGGGGGGTGTDSGQEGEGGGGGGATRVIRDADSADIAIGEGGGGGGGAGSDFEAGGGGGGGARGGAGSTTGFESGQDGGGTGDGGDGGDGSFDANGSPGTDGGQTAHPDLTETTTTTGGGNTGSASVTLVPAVAWPTPGLTAQTDAQGVALAWNDADEEDEYEIHRSATQGFTPGPGTLVATVGAGTTSYTDTGVTEGQLTYYRAIAQNSAPSSVTSGEASAVSYLPPNSGLSISNIDTDSADTSWTDNATDETAHRVLLSRGRRYFDFDGTDDFMESVDYDTQTLTLGCWVNADGIPPSNSAFIIGVPDECIFEWRANTNLEFAVFGSSAGYTTATAAVDLSSGWTHIALSYDGSTIRGYVDGGEVDATSASLTVADTAQPFSIGGKAGSPSWGDGFQSYLDGAISDVVLYDRALSSSEVATLAGDAIPAPADLLAYYPLHEDRSGTTPDMSGYDNDATIAGATVGGDAYTDESGALAANTTAYSLTGLLNGEQYRAKVRVETNDAEAETK